MTGQDPDSADLAFSVVAGPVNGGALTGTPPNLTYLSALNYNGSDSFTFKVKETSTWIAPVSGIDRNQESDPPPATVSITVTPVNDKPSFTKGPNQTVTQPAGAQTILNWATAFSPGPPDESSQNVLAYHVVSNTNSALFSAGPVVDKNLSDNNGTLTYTPAAGLTGCPCSATIGVTVQDTGGTTEGHGAVDTSVPQTFTITINPPVVTTTLTSAGPADVWFSNPNTNSNSKLNKYDLKAEVLRVLNDGTLVPVTSGELKNVNLSYNGTSFSKAVLKVIGLLPTTLSPGVPFAAGEALRLRVSVRYVSGTPSTGSLRLWFNTPVAANDTSHLHAKLGGPDIRYHLVGSAPTHMETMFPLQKTILPSGPTQYVERMSLPKVGSSGAYTVLGAWSITGP